MVHRHRSNDDQIAPAYAGRLNQGPIPKNSLPDDSSPPEAVYRMIHDELLLDGSSRLNMATFVTTWMEPEADRLMAETFDKNMIDKDEYPQTAEIERRCVNIVADLFHAPGDGDAIGVSTIGSSEAVMLAGLAMKWKWRARREAAGLPTDRPNMVMGSNVQVVWEKFCRYWDVEPRYVPVSENRFVVDPDDVMDRVDEHTVGVIPILGTTYTGEYEPIKEIHDRVVAHNEATGHDIPIHVDAASGGFVAPFLQPDLEWDFRLPQVKSINVSGHKYGLTYPGMGFAVWRSADDLPEDLIFHVNYLGGDMPTFTLNFSRPGNQIVGQYYNFVRLGRDGYRRIMESLRAIALHLSSEIGAMPEFDVVSDGSAIPVLAFRMQGDQPFNVFHVSDKLRQGGWQVPAYTMPADATDVAVLRIVVREGFTLDLAEGLLEDLRDAVDHLRRVSPGAPGPADELRPHLSPGSRPIDHTAIPVRIPPALGRWIAVSFMVGSTLFAVASLPAFVARVDARAVGATFVIGSIFFTAAAYGQFLQVVNGPSSQPGVGRRYWSWSPRDTAWTTVAVQLFGTVMFNISTSTAMVDTLDTYEEVNRLVWGPDVFGSLAFLIASYLAYRSVCGGRWCIETASDGWRIGAWNLVGSILFGVSAIASFTLPTTGEELNVALVNAATFGGAVCFLAGAVVLLRSERRSEAS